jgi:putative ABC transport system permease protein
MLRNYFTIAFRQFRRGGTHVAVNVLGLALGTATCILLSLLVYNEWSYDRFHEEADAIYRTYFAYEDPDGKVSYQVMMPPDFTPEFRKTFTAVTGATRLVQSERDYLQDGTMRRFMLSEVDPDFFSMFSFPAVAGDPVATIADPRGMVISTDVARAAFGRIAPDWNAIVGETIVIPLDTTEKVFRVGAIIEPMPHNSSIAFDAAISFENYPNPFLGGNNWGGRTSTYVRLGEGHTAAGLEAVAQSTVHRLMARYTDALRSAGFLAESDDAFRIHLQPLGELHSDMNVPVPYEADPHNPTYSLILLTIGLMILLIACINFMTLSVGQSTRRAREVGVRKALGASREQVMRQHWGESLVLATLAMVAGTGLALLALPGFRTLTGMDLSFAGVPALGAVAAFALLAVVVGAVSGGYPALVLSRFAPVRVLKGDVDAPRQGLFTRSLVVLQFTISIGLIACTVIMTRQLGFMLQADLGFDDDFVVAVNAEHVADPDKPALLERLKVGLTRDDRIVDVERAGYTFTRGTDQNVWQDANGNTLGAYNYGVGYDYLDVMGMELVAGRFFSEDFPADPTSSIVVNEALVEAFGIEQPVGHVLTNWLNFVYDESPTIIGVVRDFNFLSLHEEVQPLVMNMHPRYYSWMGAVLVKIRPGDVAGALSFIEETWNQAMPGKPFTYSFVDEDLAAQYAAERRWQRILTWSSMLAIVIASMGLFGLALLAVNRRTKEIGIRKVMGATVPRLSTLLTREFAIMVLIAAALATPLAFLAMQSWLGGFAYRIDPSPWVFVLATLAALAIAVGTVAIHAVRAALANPVRSLRYE